MSCWTGPKGTDLSACSKRDFGWATIELTDRPGKRPGLENLIEAIEKLLLQ